MKDPTEAIDRWLAHDVSVVAFEVVNAEDTAVLIDTETREAYMLSTFSRYQELRRG